MKLGGKNSEVFKTPGGMKAMDAPTFVPVGRSALVEEVASPTPTAKAMRPDIVYTDMWGNTVNRDTNVSYANGRAASSPDIAEPITIYRDGGPIDVNGDNFGTNNFVESDGIQTPMNVSGNNDFIIDGQNPMDVSGMANNTLSDVPELSDAEGAIVVVREKRDDYRVRLSALMGGTTAEQVYGVNDRSSNVMAILHSTNGLLFPYTPTITQSQSVNWEALALAQTNYDIYGYRGTPSVSLSVSGLFTAQNQREGEYCAAVLHFLRTMAKGYFGEEDRKNGKAGLPPPVLRFHGYGSLMFNNVYVVLKSWNYTFEDGVDMNLFKLRDGNTAKIPAKFTISMELGVTQNPVTQRTQFSLDKFRTGELLKNNSGWI